jgi:flagellar protein FliO/FliZ
MYAPLDLPVPRLAATPSPWLDHAVRIACVLLLLLLLAPGVALASGATSFAAPTPVAPFAAPNDGMPLLRVVFALLLVLGAVFAAAKLSRRVGMAGAAPTARLEVVAQAPLGPRERAVLLRVGGREVLLGVATGNVRLLLDMNSGVGVAAPAPDESTTRAVAMAESAARPTFRDMLMRSLGR